MAVLMSNAGTVITVPWVLQMKINNEKRIMKESLKHLERQNEENMRMLNRQQKLAIKKKQQFQQKWQASSKHRNTAESSSKFPGNVPVKVPVLATVPVKVLTKVPVKVPAKVPVKVPAKPPPVAHSSLHQGLQPPQHPLSTSERYWMSLKGSGYLEAMASRHHKNAQSAEHKPIAWKLPKVHFYTKLPSISSQATAKTTHLQLP